jgi:Uma2 family endonuclease
LPGRARWAILKADEVRAMIDPDERTTGEAREGLAVSYSGRRPPLTVRHYELMPEDGNRHEIIGGDHFMTPAPSLWHQDISRILMLLLAPWARKHHRGRVYDAPVDVQLGDNDIVQPDVVFVSTERKAILTPQRIVGAPDLVVEILSPSTADRDREVKRDTYDRFGVIEYWIVDPDACAITVLARDAAARLVEVAVFAGEDVLTSTLLEGFSAPLAEVFERDG